MKIKDICICAAVMMTMSATAHAEARPGAGPPGLEPIADQFFQQLKKGNGTEAFRSAMKDTYQYLGPGSVDGMSAQISTLVASFGGVIDWSPLASDAMTPTFVRSTYYVRTKTAPLFVTFLFYQTGNTWMAVDIQLGTYYNEKEKGHLVEPAGH